MSAKYRTYKIQQGDTLNSIAEKLEVAPEELKKFHNSKSSFDNVLPFSGIPAHLTEIIIPTIGFGLEDGKEVWLGKGTPIRVNRLQYNGDLFCAPFTGNWSYGIVKTIKNGEKTTTITYTVNLNYYLTDGIRYVSVDMVSDTFVNDKKPDLIVDELALACTKTLYPILFKINTDGTLNSIENHAAIMERWLLSKKQLSKYYKGNTVKEYLHHFEKVIKEAPLLLHHLQNDWFFHFYFDAIYHGYRNYIMEYTKKIPLIPFTAKVAYQVTQVLHPYLENNYIRIQSKGHCTDKRNHNDLENGYYFPTDPLQSSTVKGNYRAVYMLHRKTSRIKYLYIESTLKLSKEKHMTISISEIENTIPKENLRHPKEIKSARKSPWWQQII
ncbi:hypothetical protein [Tenacibaculum maritimum]|uniref:hypothetical protein n=1 Tax=Tenacibaculum maritimum TaxID=107401 RepID=UPI003875E8FA